MIASHQALPTQAVSSSEAAPPVRRARRWPRHEDFFPLAYYLVVATTLAATGYPAWRLAILALAAGAQQACLVGCRKRDFKRCVNAGADQIAWFVVLSQSGLFIATGLTAAVTGGVRSPLLVTFIAAYFAAVAEVGDRRPTRLLLAATGIGIGVLALLPRGWTGPALASSVNDLLTAVSVLGVGALLAPVNAETIVAYCGSGITACHDLLALEIIGRPDALLYEGSWSDWARDPALEAAQGKA